MRVYKTKWFVRYARSERIEDHSLCEAVERAERGIIDADLGGGVIKQRVARPGRGRSGGYRVLVAYRCGELAVFMYGFAKKERDNIEDDELETLRNIASDLFRSTAECLDRQVREGRLQEVKS